MARPKNPNVSEEQRERNRLYKRQWLAKRRLEEMKSKEMNNNMGIVDLNNQPEVTTIDYKKMYTEEKAKTVSLETKVAELEKLCKSYAENANAANTKLQRATLEYNARVKYILDCIRHLQISVQLATTATESTEGGN